MLSNCCGNYATYEDVMEWHSQANNKLKPHESVFHRRREKKAKLSPPWDTTNFEPKLLIQSTHSFLPGDLSGVTSLSKTFNQDFYAFSMEGKLSS